VLLTAEVIAKVYYAALRKATGSVVLQCLCDQILHDEIYHVRFQTQRLAALRGERPRWRVAYAQGLQRFLFWGTCWVVWLKYRRAFRAGGYGFPRFRRSSWREMARALILMDPRNYAERALLSVGGRNAAILLRMSAVSPGHLPR
jgi:hypothetical protein